MKFAAVYSHVPEVVALHFVYWAALITTVVVTVRECSRLSVPGRPGFRRALGWFAVALGMDLVNVGLTATALLGSKAGTEQLAGVAESAWVSTIAGCIAANIALASMVLRSRRAERQDRRTLQNLHDLVVGRDPAVEQDPHILLAPAGHCGPGSTPASNSTPSWPRPMTGAGGSARGGAPSRPRPSPAWLGRPASRTSTKGCPPAGTRRRHRKRRSCCMPHRPVTPASPHCPSAPSR